MSSKNPKLLILLRKGCQVIFPSGFVMEGLPKDDAIQMGIFDGEKVLSLDLIKMDEQGLVVAIQNEELYAAMQEDKEEEEKELAKTEM